MKLFYLFIFFFLCETRRIDYATLKMIFECSLTLQTRLTISRIFHQFIQHPQRDLFTRPQYFFQLSNFHIKFTIFNFLLNFSHSQIFQFVIEPTRNDKIFVDIIENLAMHFFFLFSPFIFAYDRNTYGYDKIYDIQQQSLAYD